MEDSDSDKSRSDFPTRANEKLLGEAVKPRFELINVIHELLHEDIVCVDCQSDVVALLGTNGTLTIRDMDKEKSPPITAHVRNPARVFVQPSGRHVIASGSDGELYFFDSHSKKIALHFPLCQNIKTDAIHVPVANTTNNVADSVFWVHECVIRGGSGACVAQSSGVTTISGSCGANNYFASITGGAALAPFGGAGATAVGSDSITVIVLLVGTRINGLIFELRIEVNSDLTVRYWCKQLLQLPPENYQLPITAIEAERLSHGSPSSKGGSEDELVVFIATPSRLFRVEGFGTPVRLLAAASSNPSMLMVREAAGAAADAGMRGGLQIYRTGSAERSEGQSYCWASVGGLVHGLFRRPVRGVHPSETFIIEPQTANGVVNEQLLPLAKIRVAENSGVRALPFRNPSQVALTAFHIILLYEDRVMVLNHPAGLVWRAGSSGARVTDMVSGSEVLERIRFDPFRNAKRARRLTGVIRDVARRRVYLYGPESIWELVIENEHRTQWKHFFERALDSQLSRYLRHRYFTAAFNLCLYHPKQRNTVQFARGKYYLSVGMVKTATTILADCDWFEEIFHLLVSLRNHKVIRWYLEKRQAFLVRYRGSYSAMLVPLACITALLTVYKLDAITRSEDSSSKLLDATNSLSNFLRQAIDDVPTLFRSNQNYYETIARLMSSQGRTTCMVAFAETMSRLHFIVRYLIGQEMYAAACDQLSAHATQPAIEPIWYEFSPVLITKSPIRLIAAMQRAVAKDSVGQTYQLLRVERLIPCFINYTVSMNEDSSNQENQVIVFLERSITKYNCSSIVVHNYYVSLLTKHDPERLEEYLDVSVLYSVDYALRRCLECRRFRQCIILYKRLDLYEDALITALECSQPDHSGQWAGLTTAKAMLRSPLPERFDAVALKKLWLIVAQYVIDRVGTRAALAVVEESDGVLKLEDILDRMSDSTVVQVFKDAVCRSLDAYSVAISDLNAKHLEANQIAERVKQDIGQLRHRYGYVTAKQRCVLCHRGLLRGAAPFLVFPNCGHVMHEQCVVQRLANLGGIESFLANESLPHRYMDGVKSLEDLAQVECALCGECAIMEIDVDLFVPDATWAVK